MEAPVPKYANDSRRYHPNRAEKRPDNIRPGMENPPMRPRAVAAAEDEIPMSVACGTMCVEMIWKLNTPTTLTKRMAAKVNET